jgi:UPF0755 protein
VTTPKPRTTPNPKARRVAAKAPKLPVPASPSDAAPPAKPPRAPRPAARRSAKPGRSSPPSQRFRPAAWKTAAAVILTCLLLPPLAIGGFAILPGSGSGRPVELDWPSPADPAEAARRVAAAGLVRSELLARAYFTLAGGASSVETGTHLLQDDMSPRTLWRRLLRMPGGATVRVTIPEGFNKFEIARRLQEKGVCSARAFIAATTDPVLLRDLRQPGPDIEGFLFPATYELARNAAPGKIIRRLAIEADRRYADVFDKNADALHELEQSFGWSRRDVINLASIVEKEAAVDDERPIIASVFLNRLRDPKFRPERRLQSDPTAVYGCLLRPDVTPTCAHADRGATGPMVRDPLNPYSTYAHPGLPPGPIANPSLRSIEAVLHPAATKYFYFVAKGGGRHTFSETYAEHRDAIPSAP